TAARACPRPKSMACEPFHDLGSIFFVREVLVTLALTPTRIGIQPHLAGQRLFSEHCRDVSRSWRQPEARERACRSGSVRRDPVERCADGAGCRVARRNFTP